MYNWPKQHVIHTLTRVSEFLYGLCVQTCPHHNKYQFNLKYCNHSREMCSSRTTLTKLCHTCQVCSVCIGNKYQGFIFCFSHLHLFNITWVKCFGKWDSTVSSSLPFKRKEQRWFICHSWYNPLPLPVIMYFYYPHCCTCALCICQK